jgi:hypothetical protein
MIMEIKRDFMTDGDAQVELTIIPAEPGWFALTRGGHDEGSDVVMVQRIIAWRIHTRVFVNQIGMSGHRDHREQVINSDVEPITALGGSFSREAYYALKDPDGQIFNVDGTYASETEFLAACRDFEE